MRNVKQSCHTNAHQEKSIFHVFVVKPSLKLVARSCSEFKRLNKAFPKPNHDKILFDWHALTCLQRFSRRDYLLQYSKRMRKNSNYQKKNLATNANARLVQLYYNTYTYVNSCFSFSFFSIYYTSIHSL